MQCVNIYNNVLRFISSEQLFTRKSKLIVAVSGGADSVMLLRVLLYAGYDCVAAHCNFHLRGEEADRDEKFVVDLCKELEVQLEVAYFDTKSFALANGLSIEMAARKLRYDWFEELRLAHGADFIAVAHHADDVVETFLMNVVRGTGIHGLTGIKPKAGYVVRPFLCIFRSDIEEFMKANEYQFVTDSTNLQQDFLRNKFRLSVIPLLLTVNASAKYNILNDIQNLKEVEMLYNSTILSLRSSLVSEDPNGVMLIPISELLSTAAPATVLFEFIRDLGFTSSQCREMVNASAAKNTGRIWQSDTYHACLDRSNIRIFDMKRLEGKFEEKTVEREEVEGHVDISGLTLSALPVCDVVFDKQNKILFADMDKIKFPVSIRQWRDGDYIQPLGMKGKRKKVSDLLVDMKIPVDLKQRVRVVVDADGRIVCVEGMKSDQRFRIDGNTVSVLKISASEV